MMSTPSPALVASRSFPPWRASRTAALPSAQPTKRKPRFASRARPRDPLHPFGQWPAMLRSFTSSAIVVDDQALGAPGDLQKRFVLGDRGGPRRQREDLDPVVLGLGDPELLRLLDPADVVGAAGEGGA